MKSASRRRIRTTRRGSWMAVGGRNCPRTRRSSGRCRTRISRLAARRWMVSMARVRVLATRRREAEVSLSPTVNEAPPPQRTRIGKLVGAGCFAHRSKLRSAARHSGSSGESAGADAEAGKASRTRELPPIGGDEGRHAGAVSSQGPDSGLQSARGAPGPGIVTCAGSVAGPS
jgi:hypothetical protein